jgi:hypothetical protein
MQRSSLDSSNQWTVRSSLPTRLRLSCDELAGSPVLRHHCAVTLTCCHWLHGFRINHFNGNIVLRFPKHRRADLEPLLELALKVPTIDDELIAPLGDLRAVRWQANSSGRMALRHGSYIGAVLLAEALFPVPLAIMTAAAICSLIPIFKEIQHRLQHKEYLGHESLELAFSGLLISQGLAGEALLDQMFNDATESVKGVVSGEEEFQAESEELIDRLGEYMHLELVNTTKDSIKLSEASAGDRYRVSLQSHIFLVSKVIEGDFIVLNRLYDGDWKPRHLKAGDEVHAGGFVIKGSGLLEVKKALRDHSDYHIPKRHHRPDLTQGEVEKNINTYYRWMTPVLLGAGGLSLTFGATERALGLFQFTPVYFWETSSISAKLTALATLQLHGIHLNDPDAFIALGKVDHVVISRSCLDRMGGIKTHEHINLSSGAKKGDLLRILAGIQDFLLDNDDVPIWSDQLHKVHNPIDVIDVEINDLLTHGWAIHLADGRQLQLRELRQAAAEINQRHLNPLEIWEGETFLGYVDLLTEPGPGWSGVCEALEDLGINVHVVGVDSSAKMFDLVKSLRIRTEHIYGQFHAKERMELVSELQASGAGVAYIGYVLSDMPALSQADVSIGIEVDADSIFTSCICDIVIGPDVHWLPRMIMLSRRVNKTTTSNFGLLLSTSLATAIGSGLNWFSPLATVLLSDIPVVLAGLRNIASMNTHGVLESHDYKHRTHQVIEKRAMACRLPSARPRHSSEPTSVLAPATP